MSTNFTIRAERQILRNFDIGRAEKWYPTTASRDKTTYQPYQERVITKVEAGVGIEPAYTALQAAA